MNGHDIYQMSLLGRVALVTGSSSGIGASVCKALAQQGMTVIGVARNIKPIQQLSNDLRDEPGTLKAFACDVTKDDEVTLLFDKIDELYGGVDICINNAGMGYARSLLDGSPREWRTMLDTNVVALCHCAKLSIKSMRKRGLDDGHVINISSLAGHLLSTSTPIHFYSATKHAVRSITEGLRKELRELNSHIRVSSISPGVVETDFFRRLLNSEVESEKILSAHVNLSANDVTRSILHILKAPPHVEINDIIIRPVEQIP